MTHWSLDVSDNTDRAVRAFLAQSGRDEEDISRFVEEAVRNVLFQQTVEHIKERNAAYDQQEIMDTVDEAVAWARAHRS